VAAVLLMGGGLVALQTATITTGLPFAVILLGMCYSLHKGLKEYSGPQEFTLGIPKQQVRFRVKRKPVLDRTFGRRKFW
jgi:choline/glycine/proline betaine transport protein